MNGAVKRIACIFCSAFASLLPIPSIAQPRLAEIFTNHVIVQREKPLRLRGTAERNSPVTVSLAGLTKTARTDTYGNWLIVWPRLQAGGPYTPTVTDREGGTAQVKDVMVGDVFLCGGQSNMSHLVKHATDAAAELRLPSESGIRFVTVPWEESALPQTAIGNPIQWKVDAPGVRGEAQPPNSARDD